MTDLIDDHPPGPVAVPHDAECVICFVDRMVRTHGCGNQLTWASLWRNLRAPRATALEERLGSKGGFCDCEVLMNAYVRRGLFDARISGTWTDEDEAFEAQEPPPCLGVRPGSSQACGHWVQRRRGYW